MGFDKLVMMDTWVMMLINDGLMMVFNQDGYNSRALLIAVDDGLLKGSCSQL